MLFGIEAQRDANLVEAVEALAQGQPVLASHRLNQADQLRGGTDTARLKAVLALVQRDFDEAWLQYRRARRSTGG
jgi:hypothetical protein